MKKKGVFLLLTLVILVLFFFGKDSNSFDGQAIIDYFIEEEEADPTFKLANWNLQILGKTKANNSELMDSYREKISEYDVVFVQEIRDKSGEAFVSLCEGLEGYSCMNSSRAGTSNTKEQYGLVYRDGIEVEAFVDYNEEYKDKFERPPLKVGLDFGDYSVTVYNIHVDPDLVDLELEELEDLVENKGNVVIIGDLNADCRYYDVDDKGFERWDWLIKDSQDTTVGSTSCAYDRIIINNKMDDYVVSYGIDKDVTKEQSDHYLIWVGLI